MLPENMLLSKRKKTKSFFKLIKFLEFLSPRMVSKLEHSQKNRQKTRKFSFINSIRNNIYENSNQTKIR